MASLSLASIRDRLADGRPRVKGPWTIERAARHCAQSIDYSLVGYPRERGWLVRKVFGPMALRRAIARGRLGHEPDANIPGAMEIQISGRDEEGLAELLKCIDRYLKWRGPLAPHFAYGLLDRQTYEQAHALHIADHFDLT